MRFMITAVDGERVQTMPAHGLTQNTAEARVLRALKARDERDGVPSAWRVTRSVRAERD